MTEDTPWYWCSAGMCQCPAMRCTREGCRGTSCNGGDCPVCPGADVVEAAAKMLAAGATEADFPPWRPR